MTLFQKIYTPHYFNIKSSVITNFTLLERNTPHLAIINDLERQSIQRIENWFYWATGAFQIRNEVYMRNKVIHLYIFPIIDMLET